MRSWVDQAKVWLHSTISSNVKWSSLTVESLLITYFCNSMTYSAIMLLKSKTDFIFDNPHVVIKMSFAGENSKNLGYFIVGITRSPLVWGIRGNEIASRNAVGHQSESLLQECCWILQKKDLGQRVSSKHAAGSCRARAECRVSLMPSFFCSHRKKGDESKTRRNLSFPDKNFLWLKTYKLYLWKEDMHFG